MFSVIKLKIGQTLNPSDWIPNFNRSKIESPWLWQFHYWISVLFMFDTHLCGIHALELIEIEIWISYSQSRFDGVNLKALHCYTNSSALWNTEMTTKNRVYKSLKWHHLQSNEDMYINVKMRASCHLKCLLLSIWQWLHVKYMTCL